MFKWLLAKIFGTQAERDLKKLQPIVAAANELEAGIKPLTDAQLRAKTAEFKEKLSQGATLDDILVEAFAGVRETAWRRVAMRHFDVQLIGGAVLHQGKIAEMKTGEGKTLVATLPAYLNALAGKGVQMGRDRPGAAVTSQRVRALLIRHEPQHVRARLRLSFRGCRFAAGTGCDGKP